MMEHDVTTKMNGIITAASIILSARKLLIREILKNAKVIVKILSIFFNKDPKRKKL